MSSHEAERRHLERQIAYARPIIQLMALVALLELNRSHDTRRAVIFLWGYLGFTLIVLLVEHLFRAREWRLPLLVDLAALGVFLALSPSDVAVWFPYLFVAYAAGIRWGLRWAVLLAGIVSLTMVARTIQRGEIHWSMAISWIGFVAGTFAAGAGLGFLGSRNRAHARESEFLLRLTATLQVDQGMAESLRLMLDELAREFACSEAYLAYRDAELERIFVWKVKVGESERVSPENLTMSRADSYLLDDLDSTVCWNSVEGAGVGFGWDRRDARKLKNLPRVPGPSQQELQLRSLMSVAFEQEGRTAGRLFVVNGQRRFSKRDLGRLELLARQVSSPLENLFLLRHMRARSIEGERSRISRDLHDGILQTLLSIEIQLDVLRRRLPGSPDQVMSGLANLQQTVRNESAELRHMVTDLKPLKVQSADLVDLMHGFAERYRNESGPALDLLIDSAQLQAPDRVCREIFQIYREALNNIKKHAKASHVVVKLSQDDSRIVLVVDDNGEGFSFAGRFTGDELDRLRLGPISIKERTRTVGGVLMVESSPGHGARLTIEVPLG